MVYGQDALAQIWQQTQLQHNALSDGSQNIDIHKETTGQSITKLNAQNQRLGDAIDDIQGNIAGEATVISNTHGGNTNRANTIGTEGVSANLLNADDDVSLLFEDVQLRKDDYGEKGNNIYDFLDALGESEEDFDLLEFFTNEDTFENAYEMYGKGDVDFEDFVKFDFGKFDDDLGFEIDFDDKDNTLTLYFPDADTGYRYGDDEEDGNHSNTNSAASSSNSSSGFNNASSTGRANRSNGNGNKHGHFRQRVRYDGNVQGSQREIKRLNEVQNQGHGHHNRHED